MKKGDKVTLTRNEMSMGALVGLKRRLHSIFRGLKDRKNLDRKSEAELWYFNLVGAMGEVAFAKGSNLHWTGSVDVSKKEPDVLPDWQVRCVAKEHYHLPVYTNDLPQFKYALMIGDGPTFIFGGYIEGTEAKRKEWFHDKSGCNDPCYWVPQKNLN